MPEAVPFRGRAKWGDVVFNLALAAFGGLLAWGVLTQVPARVVPMHALAAYTVFAVVATVALAVALATTRQLPTLGPVRRGSQEVLVVRAWPGEWWHAMLLDLGLAVLGVALAVMGIRAGSDWLVPGLLVGGVGVWFLGRVVLGLTGRRRNEALWLTDSEVVHDSSWGRAQSPRGRVVDVRAVGKSVVMVLAAPAELHPCPRPWRLGRRRAAPGSIVVDSSMMGHDADGLAVWLRVELGKDPGGEPSRASYSA